MGEPSIVIAVSSPHRKEAFMACEHILEEVKLKAQIWKREFYEGEREERRGRSTEGFRKMTGQGVAWRTRTRRWRM